MKPNPTLALTMALTTIVGAAIVTAIQAGAGTSAAPPRPKGPCDIYVAAGDPCVAAHSTTRALYAAYNGPLYQVLRQSDGKTLDIVVVARPRATAGDTPTRPRRMCSAPTRIASSRRSTTSPTSTTI